MAYNKERLFQKICSKIKRDKSITTIDEARIEAGIDRATFYNHFSPNSCSNSTYYENIVDLLLENATNIKKKMKKNWESKKAAPILQLSRFRLLANRDEFNRVSTSNVDITSAGQQILADTSVNIEGEPRKLVENNQNNKLCDILATTKKQIIETKKIESANLVEK
uniref:Uncharacterized protein n=1 Tax=viral metagenome TaxID=1070528 RepID=A0A6M3IZ43_9ZZZZ